MTPLTAVAMSGGLDSSVTALLLAEQGEPVLGLSMLLWDQGGETSNGRCCGALDLSDARRVAAQVGFPHYTLRLDREFRDQVVDPFVEDYLSGKTPSPCVRCNTWIKFDLLLEKARALGAARVATGHYARILDGPEGPELHRATDLEKDQSYYLFELTAEQLAASRFPLGTMSKEEVRGIARRAGLAVAEKGESMEVCFVASGIEEFVAAEAAARPERFPALPKAGAAIVNRQGETLGEGAPYYRYTVGQRRGLKVSASERLYVLGVEPGANRVVVGTEGELLAGGLRGERLHWIGDPRAFTEADGTVRATVRIRSRHPGVEASIHPLAGGETEIRFDEPQKGVAPGQAAVFYRGSRVLGGCWISSALGAAMTSTNSPLSDGRAASSARSSESLPRLTSS